CGLRGERTWLPLSARRVLERPTHCAVRRSVAILDRQLHYLARNSCRPRLRAPPARRRRPSNQDHCAPEDASLRSKVQRCFGACSEESCLGKRVGRAPCLRSGAEGPSGVLYVAGCWYPRDTTQ